MHGALFAGTASISSPLPTFLPSATFLASHCRLFPPDISCYTTTITTLPHQHRTWTRPKDFILLLFAFCHLFTNWSGQFWITRTIHQDDKPQPTGHTIRQVPLSSLFIFTCLSLATCVAKGSCLYLSLCYVLVAVLPRPYATYDQNDHDGASSQLGVDRPLSN